MRNKQGFSLVLFLVYLFFFSLISCCMCHIITVFIIPSLQATRLYQKQILLHVSSDLFVRDIRNKPIKQWKLIQPHYLIWNNGEHDIGWHFYDNKVERIEGIYENKWKKKRTSVVISKLKDTFFELDYSNGKVVGVGLTLISLCNKEKPVISYAAVRSYAQ